MVLHVQAVAFALLLVHPRSQPAVFGRRLRKLCAQLGDGLRVQGTQLGERPAFAGFQIGDGPAVLGAQAIPLALVLVDPRSQPASLG